MRRRGTGVVWWLARGAAVAAILLLSFTSPPSGPPASRSRPRIVYHPDAAYCYAPGTPLDVVEKNPYPFSDAGPTPLFNVGSRWSGAAGTPRALTWSFIPDGVTVDGEANELFSRLDALFASQGGRAKWISLFQACFDRWSQLAGLSYTRITFNGSDWDDGAVWTSSGSSTRGDIRIGMIPVDGASNVLAYNYFPSGGGDMVLDRAENWASTANNFRFMRNILMHEHGHGMGLRHVCPSNATKLMEPFLSTSYDGPRHDDIRAAHHLYGDPYELNGSSAAATALGTLPVSGSLSLGAVPAPSVSNASLLSIESNNQQDYFQFDVASPAAVRVTVTPVGLAYDSSTQNVDASCNSGNNIDSLALHDLSLEVIASNGTTVLASANAAPAGSSETIAAVTLAAAGTYYIRVYESNTPGQPQMYTLSITNLDCNGNGVSDATDIAEGTSQDCNNNALPDECESTPSSDQNGNLVLDICEYRHGDFDLDGDTDMTDFANLQRCLSTPLEPGCSKTDMAGSTSIDAIDVTAFAACLSGAGVPYKPACN